MLWSPLDGGSGRAVSWVWMHSALTGHTLREFSSSVRSQRRLYGMPAGARVCAVELDDRGAPPPADLHAHVHAHRRIRAPTYSCADVLAHMHTSAYMHSDVHVC